MVLRSWERSTLRSCLISTTTGCASGSMMLVEDSAVVLVEGPAGKKFILESVLAWELSLTIYADDGGRTGSCSEGA